MTGKTERFSTAGGLIWIMLTLLAVAVSLFAGRDVIQPFRFLLWHSVSLAWFVVIIVSAWGQGILFVKIASNPEDDVDPPVQSLVALGLGLGILSLETFGLAGAGLMNPVFLTALAAGVFVFSLLFSRRYWTGFRVHAEFLREAASGSRLPLSLAGIAVVVSWPFALLPTRAFDALSYHLEVPLRYLQAGRIIDLPENLYSYAPQLTHSLYGLALGLSGSDLAGLLNHLFFVLTLGTLWLGFKDRFGREGSAWAMALAALSPMMLIEVANSGVDWSAAFYTLAALCLLSARKIVFGRVLLAGILAGMAAGCRHHPLVYAIILPPLAGFADDIVSRRNPRIRTWVIYTGVAILAASPWYIRNWVFTGDPLFPLLANLMGKTDAGSGWVGGIVGVKSTALLWRWVLLPIKMVFDPLSYSMTATIGIQYLALLPLILWRKWRASGNRFLLFWLILAFLAWYLNYRTARYSMPILLLAALWLGTALAGAVKGSSMWSRSLAAAITFTLVLNAGVFVGIQDRVNRGVGAALGMMSSSRYLMEFYEVYPAIDYLNNLDPPPGRVLFLGEMRGFYSNFPREAPSHNRPNRLLTMVREGKPLEDIHKELKKTGFTHILFNPSEWRRMAYGNRNAPQWRLSEEQDRYLSEFLVQWTQMVFSGKGILVYQLRESPASG